VVAPNLLCAGRLHDLERAVLEKARKGQIVRMIFVGDANGGNSPRIFQSRVNAHAIGLERQRSAMSGGGHRTWKGFQARLEARTPPRQIASRRHRPAGGLRTYARIDAAAAIEPALRIGEVEVMQDASDLYALVLVEFMFEHRL